MLSIAINVGYFFYLVLENFISIKDNMKEVLTEEVQLVTREEEYMISTPDYVKFFVL